MSSPVLSLKEQAEQEDKKLLTENGQQVQEVMQLLSDGETRTAAKSRVKHAKEKTKKGGGSQLVFHPYKGKRIPITEQASDYLALSDALETSLLTQQHNNDLQKALVNLTIKRVEILERRLRRN